MAIGTTKELKDAYNELLEYEDECIKLKSIQDGQFSIQTVRSSEDVNPLNVTVLMKPDDSKMVKDSVIRSVVNRAEQLRKDLVNKYGLTDVDEVYDLAGGAVNVFQLVADAPAGYIFDIKELKNCSVDIEEKYYKVNTAIPIKVVANDGYKMRTAYLVDFDDWVKAGKKIDEETLTDLNKIGEDGITSEFANDRKEYLINGFAIKSNVLLFGFAIKSAV